MSAADRFAQREQSNSCWEMMFVIEGMIIHHGIRGWNRNVGSPEGRE